MADTKFSALPAAGTLDGTEIVPVVKTTGKQTTTQAIADINNTANRSRANHTGTQPLSTISDAGTAASKNTPAAGNASATEVVLGSDTRLSDARTPTTHSHAESDVTNLVTDLAGKASTSHSHSGLAPVGGTVGQVLKKNSSTDYDYSWAADSTGAGGSPGGSDTQIQFNDGGAFGGDADFTWNKTTNDLVLGGTDTGITLKGITTEPSAPAADNLHIYSKKIAGKMLPKIKGPSGLDTPLQNAFWQNNITMWSTTTATAGVWLGTAGSGAGTYSTALPTTTNLYTAMKRGRWANVVTTTNQVLGQRNTEAMYMVSPSNAGQGGFFFYARCGFDVWTNGGRFFAGFHSATTVVTADPSALNNTVGFCVDAGDAGAISFLTRGTAATKASTGFTITSQKGYDLYITCLPGTNTYYWRIVDIVAGTEASGTATATPPANNTMLTVGVLASNAALTPVTSIQLGLNRIYVETDY